MPPAPSTMTFIGVRLKLGPAVVNLARNGARCRWHPWADPPRSVANSAGSRRDVRTDRAPRRSRRTGAAGRLRDARAADGYQSSVAAGSKRARGNQPSWLQRRASAKPSRRRRRAIRRAWTHRSGSLPLAAAAAALRRLRMKLEELVQVSAGVAGTSGRLEKISRLAGLLTRLSPDEVPIAVGFL